MRNRPEPVSLLRSWDYFGDYMLSCISILWMLGNGGWKAHAGETCRVECGGQPGHSILGLRARVIPSIILVVKTR
ncbi:hypothetical protein H106_08231 [Trichophyton rubrum CBS 735.88]|nr:hypothetical protein H106_08231 [Trichophyton rubrum CBS 735.88]